MTALVDDGWVLADAREPDIDELMSWFNDSVDVSIWGGPKFRFPFTPDTFREDCHWPDMASLALRDPQRRFSAFGQLYDRNGRINLARLIVHPRRRRQGIGRRLVSMLMSVGPRLLPLEEFSLFVYRGNLAALECYRSLGFEISEYPADEILADKCYYLTRVVADTEKAASS